MCLDTLEEAIFSKNERTIEIKKQKYNITGGYTVLQNYTLTFEELTLERTALNTDLWSVDIRRYKSLKNKMAEIEENYQFSEENYKKVVEIKNMYTINNYLKNLFIFQYGKNKTKVINHKEEVMQYFYDKNGIIFQKVDSNNQVVSFDYINDEKKSQLLYTKNPGFEISSENLIKNGDFSDTDSLTDIHFGWNLDDISLEMSSLSNQIEGKRNYEANITMSKNFLMEQNIPLQEGKYDIKLFYKLLKKDTIDSNVRFVIKKVYLTGENALYEEILENNYLEDSVSRREKIVSSISISKIEREKNVNLVIQISSDGNPSKLCLEEITLTKRGIVYRKNYIKNSRFRSNHLGKPIQFETQSLNNEDQIKIEEDFDF